MNLNMLKMSNFRYFFVGVVLLHLLSLFFVSDVGDNIIASVPVDLGITALSGGFGMLNNFIGNDMSKSNARYQLELQKRLMQYEWQNFSSPQAKAKAYAEIGLNPSVMAGQGGMNPISPSMSAPSVAPSTSNSPNIDIAGSLLAASQAKKAGMEAEGQELSNKLFKDTYKQQVEKIGLDNHWTEEQTAKISQEIGLMTGEFQLCQQKIDNLRSEKKLTDEQIKWFGRHQKAEIDNLRSSSAYQNALKGLTDSQKQLLDRTMDDLCDITSYQADQMSKIVELLGKYGDAQAIVGMLSQVVGSASDLIGSITSLKNVGKITETITGSTTQKSDGSWTTTNSRTTRK